MKPRPSGFLNQDLLDPEVFDYIRELHEYLWRIVKAVIPGASGNLKDYLDSAIVRLEAMRAVVKASHRLLDRMESRDGDGATCVWYVPRAEDVDALGAALSRLLGEQP